jgi:hypothetical protein
MKKAIFTSAAKFFRFSLLLLAFAPGPVAEAQIETQEVTYFEGSLHFVIRVSGKFAESFLLDEPPNQMDMYLKDDNIIVNELGGQKGKMFLFIGDSNHTYIVDAPNKRAFLRDYYMDTSNVVPEAVATGKTLTVYGNLCQEYKTTFPDRISYYYVCDKYRMDVSKYEGKTEAKASFLIKGLDGRIPLKTRNVTPNLTIDVECTKAVLATYETAFFRIPQDFKLGKRDPR